MSRQKHFWRFLEHKVCALFFCVRLCCIIKQYYKYESMKLKIFLAVLILTSVFCVANIAYAQAMSDAQRQALIAQIKQSILQLQAELNQLIIKQQNCTASWQCGSWGLCINGQQSRVCNDANECGFGTNIPKISQACVEQPAVKLQVNGSDGPVNIFLTLNNGAYINSLGLNLTATVNLSWDGIDVASCVASDSLKTPGFSGYKASSGSQSVAISGNIQTISTTSSKVVDNIRITCISIKSGSSISSTVTANLFYNTNTNCSPNWSCTAWTTCNGSSQTRTCTDWNGCGSSVGMPLKTESCVPAPAVNIEANNSNGPIVIANGASVTLAWASSHAASCTAWGGWSGALATSGSQKISGLTSNKSFSITCSNNAGTATDSVLVNVSAPVVK
jgi:hypothetical protein